MTTLAQRPVADPAASSPGAPVPVSWWVLGAAAGIAVLGLLLDPARQTDWVLLGGAALFAAVVLLMPRWTVPYLATLGVCLEIGSGVWGLLGSPLPLDRGVLVVTYLVAVRHALRDGTTIVRRQPMLWLILALLGWTAASAALAGTLTTSIGLYALIDNQGIMPAVIFALAPLLFPDERARTVLLVGLTAVGAYLAFTAFVQGLGADALVFPRYVLDPAIGTHVERARGIFLDPSANGLSLFGCAIASVLLARRIPGRRAVQALVLLVGTACLVGVLFTLTRGIWLAVTAGVLAATVVSPPVRRRVVPLLPVLVGLVVAFLLLTPGFLDKAQTRADDLGPVYDRRNIAAAGFRAVEAHPVLGTGWSTFQDVGESYVRQSDSYPITNVRIQVHNIPLSRAAETGIPGAVLWIATQLGLVLGPLRRGGLRSPWAVAMVAFSVCVLTSAQFSPLTYTLPTLLMWLLSSFAYVDRDARLAAAQEDAA